MQLIDPRGMIVDLIQVDVEIRMLAQAETLLSHPSFQVLQTLRSSDNPPLVQLPPASLQLLNYLGLTILLLLPLTCLIHWIENGRDLEMILAREMVSCDWTHCYTTSYLTQTRVVVGLMLATNGYIHLINLALQKDQIPGYLHVVDHVRLSN